MKSGKDLLKTSIRKICSRRLQSKLRLFYVARQIVKNKGFHEAEMNLLESLVLAGDCVADVGANVGAYTKELSRLVGSSGKVYSFEPISDNYDILQSVIRNVNLANVRSFNVALGSTPGQYEMVIPDSAAFIGFYLAHLARPGDTGQRIWVETLTLDELWKSNIITDLDFIKCDVEGGEFEVIQGGLELIQSQRPGWLLEVSREMSSKVFGLLETLGYQAFVYNKKLIKTEGYRDKEFSNYFFFHPSSKSWSRALPLTVEC